MRKIITIMMLLLLSINIAYAQVEAKVDKPLGFRIKSNGIDYRIYVDENNKPKLDDYRKINYKVYYRKADYPVETVNGEKYQLITIPSTTKEDLQGNGNAALAPPPVSESGDMVSKVDYDKSFWIKESDIVNNSQIEYFRYQNDFFAGALTAPFKYRFAVGDKAQSVIDGDFNVAPFIGWKWRLSKSEPYYWAPFGFAGITTLDYNSANNSKITDPDITESGSGFTYGFGISFKFGSVSPGFIIGWDNSFGNLGEGFVYKDKPWISFSVNFDFFKPKATEVVEQK